MQDFYEHLRYKMREKGYTNIQLHDKPHLSNRKISCEKYHEGTGSWVYIAFLLVDDEYDMAATNRYLEDLAAEFKKATS